MSLIGAHVSSFYIAPQHLDVSSGCCQRLKSEPPAQNTALLLPQVSGFSKSSV